MEDGLDVAPDGHPPRRGLTLRGTWLARYWPYIVAVVGVVAVLCVLPTIVGRRSVAIQRARLKALGVPDNIGEMMPPVPDRQNAAVLYQRAAPGLRGWGYQGPVARLLAASRAGSSLPPGLRPSLAQVEAEIALHAADLELLRQGSLRPACRFSVDWSEPWNGWHSIWNQGVFGTVIGSEYLTAKALVAAQRGRSGEALENLATVMRMGEHIAVVPTNAAQTMRVRFSLTRVSWYLPSILTAAPPTEAQARRFYNVLRSADLVAEWRRALRGDTVMGEAQFTEARRTPHLNPSGFLQSGPTGNWDRVMKRLGPKGKYVWVSVSNLDESWYLEFMRRMIVASKKPYLEMRRAEAKAFREMKREMPAYALLSRIYLEGAFPLWSQRRDESIAQLGLMQAAMALRAYQIKHGAYPGSLAELRRTGGWAIPDDPFTGKPFVYRRWGAGYVIYSLGPNAKDDAAFAQQPMSGDSRNLAYDIPLFMAR